MPRVARIVIPDVPHHITQRGNNRQDVFFVDDDRRVYPELLAAQAERFGLKLLGYCLMDNHVHLVATPAGEASLARAVGRTDFLYTQYVNRLHGRSGLSWLVVMTQLPNEMSSVCSQARALWSRAWTWRAKRD